MNTNLQFLLLTALVCVSVAMSSEKPKLTNMKRHFSQQMNAPVFNQHNIENYQEMSKSGPTMRQTNLDVRQRFKRHFSQQYNAPIYKQQNIQNYQKQHYNGPIMKQTNIENEVKQAFDETSSFHDSFDHQLNNA